MKHLVKLAIALPALSLLAACVEDTGSVVTGTPGAAEQACLRAVTTESNNPDVVLLGSEFSQAGTNVLVGVGPQQARWSCIAYANGTTSRPVSLTNEGTL